MWPGARKLGPSASFFPPAASSSRAGSFSLAFVENFATFPLCLADLSPRDHGRALLFALDVDWEDDDEEGGEGWAPAPVEEAAAYMVAVWYTSRGLCDVAAREITSLLPNILYNAGAGREAVDLHGLDTTCKRDKERTSGSFAWQRRSVLKTQPLTG